MFMCLGLMFNITLYKRKGVLVCNITLSEYVEKRLKGVEHND